MVVGFLGFPAANDATTNLRYCGLRVNGKAAREGLLLNE